MVADPRTQMTKFLFGPDVVKIDCMNDMLLGYKNIYNLITHTFKRFNETSLRK